MHERIKGLGSIDDAYGMPIGVDISESFTILSLDYATVGRLCNR